ncbi:MAG: hypothetical protein KDJ38_20830 [Gammaproteobacteria bacterium]|nr:hypothetical protein [Gammaproteobacteria bacterium]
MSRRLRQLGLSLLIALSIVLVIFRPLDSLGSEYLDSAFKKALVSFAIARGLNGVISVAQGTEFAVQPAGVGINFSPGEILDPINDLVERFSWIMLMSSSSLGAQKVLLSISGWGWLAVVFVLVAGLYLLSLWWRNSSLAAAQTLISRLFLLLLILRFTVPLTAFLNEWVYREFLLEQYNDSSGQLQQASDEIGSINDETDVALNTPQGAESLMDKARQLYDSAMGQIDFEKKLDRYKAAAETISENTINLIVVFVLQTVIFPLLFLWLIVRVFRRLFV